MTANPWLAAFLDDGAGDFGSFGSFGTAPETTAGKAKGAKDANDTGPETPAGEANGHFGSFGMGREGRPPAPAEWVEGMARLADAEPPAGVLPSLWRARMKAGLAFARDWGGVAYACGWTDAALFALHPAAPLIRFDAMGAAFLSCGAAVVAVTDTAITLRGEAGAIRRAVRCAIPYPPAWATFGAVVSGRDA